jgi:hypothetical protein
VGSIPTVSTKNGGCSSIGRAPDCGSGGSEIVTRHLPKIRHTDKVSVRSPKPRWLGSIPRWRAKNEI